MRHLPANRLAAQQAQTCMQSLRCPLPTSPQMKMQSHLVLLQPTPQQTDKARYYLSLVRRFRLLVGVSEELPVVASNLSLNLRVNPSKFLHLRDHLKGPA